MTNLKFSVMASAISDDLRNAPRAARSAGFEGLVFDAYSPRLNLADLSGSGQRDFRHLLSAQDQQLAALAVDIGAKGIGPGADVDRVLARLDTVMETALALGTKLICVDLGPLPIPPQKPRPRKKINPDEAGLIFLPTNIAVVEEAAPVEPGSAAAEAEGSGQIDAAMEEIGKAADRYGVTVAFRSDLASLAALERAIESAACPWFGVDLDPVAILRDSWSMDDVFSRLGGLIRHVRGRDALRGADRRTRPAPIGRGSMNWGELLANINAAGYEGWLTVDSLELESRVAAAQAGAEYLRTLK
jgi:sugar phosphate isomerase/epimerase